MAACLPLIAPVLASVPAERDRVLIGASIDGRNAGALEAIREDEDFLVPLAAVCELMDVELLGVEGHTVLLTPLGRVEIPAEELELVETATFVRATDLARRLAAKFSFDEASYSLDLVLPWRPSRSDPSSAGGPSPRPDVRAPGSTLSGIRGTLTHTRVGESSSLAGDVFLRGRLDRGLWKVWAQDSTTSPFHLREYQWLNLQDRFGYLVGRQALRLHPTLADFDVAGVQVGWTNRDPAARPDFDSSILQPRRVRPQETFRGSAPPGSFVRLRIDGRFVDTRQVGYDGTFEFYNVGLPSRQIATIEYLIYEPHNLGIPVEIRRARLASSELLLPAGAMMHTAGAGYTGRFTEGLVGTGPVTPASPGGFYQWRHGIGDDVTLEASVQYAAESPQSFVGVVTRPDESWIVGAGLSGTPGALGHSLDVEGFGRRWQFYLRSSSTPREFSLSGVGSDRYDHSAELQHDTTRSLRLGLVARSRDDGFREVDYVAPSLSWRPLRTMYVDVRPDLYGEYLVSAAWQATEDTRLRVFRSTASTFEVAHRIARRWETGWNVDFGGGLPTRHTVSATWLPHRPGSWSARAGLVYAEGQPGYMGSVHAPVLPGVQVRAEYQSIPSRNTLDGSVTGRFLLAISTDLGYAAGRLVPARSLAFQAEHGALGGRIVVRDPANGLSSLSSSSGSLGDVGILVDGQVRTRTDGGGRFYIAHLGRGNHVVELDPEHLPIELQPVRSRLVVEVAAGAVTRVDFGVRPEFGLAGRIRDVEERPVPGVRVELVDAAGAVVASGRTDSFGLYRIDGVGPGTYTLRARTEPDASVLAERGVLVVDDFLFEQDLDVPALP